jgi:hypothetical protein
MRTDKLKSNSYLGVTVSYIKEGQLVDCALAIRSTDHERATGANILKTTEPVFQSYRLENFSKQITMVTDRRSNMIKAYENMTRVNCISHLN